MRQGEIGQVACLDMHTQKLSYIQDPVRGDALQIYATTKKVLETEQKK